MAEQGCDANLIAGQMFFTTLQWWAWSLSTHNITLCFKYILSPNLRNLGKKNDYKLYITGIFLDGVLVLSKDTEKKVYSRNNKFIIKYQILVKSYASMSKANCAIFTKKQYKNFLLTLNSPNPGPDLNPLISTLPLKSCGNLDEPLNLNELVC